MRKEIKRGINCMWLTLKQIKKIICMKEFWEYVASMKWLIKK